MLKTKRIALLLLMLLPFMFSSVWAFSKKAEPKIFTINEYLPVYDGIAKRIIENIKKENKDVEIKVEGLKITIIPKNVPLLKKIVTLYGELINQDASADKKYWAWDGNFGVGYNGDNSVIDSIIF